MQFSQLDLKMNGICDGMNFTHLTELMLLHYLVKVKTLKCNITAGDYQTKLHQMYHSFIKVDQDHHGS